MPGSSRAKELSPAELARNRYACRISNGCSPESIAEAGAALTAARAERYIRELVASAPPLSDEQRKKLAALLLGSADSFS